MNIENSLKEMHRGHNCETWQLLLETDAQRAVNRTTYREYKLRYGTKLTVEDGHEFFLDANGQIDIWQMDSDNHSGPGCAVCDDAWCQFCDPDIYTEKCPG